MDMAKLTNENRITVQSTSLIRDPIEDLAVRMSRRIKFKGRKLAMGPAVNAILAYFLDLDPFAQEVALVAGVRRLESILASDEAQQKSPDDAGLKGEPERLGNPALAEFVTRRVDMKTGKIIDPHAEEVITPKAKSRKKA